MKNISVMQRILIGRHPGRTLLRLLFLSVITVIVFNVALFPVWTHGRSMEPTVRDKTFHLVNGLAYRLREPRRGDIVTIRAGRKKTYLKRIIGMPGETIAFSNGALFIDGISYAETYIHNRGNWTLPAVTVGTNHYFVVGDNRTVDMAIHVKGVVERSDLMGVLLW